MSVTQILNPSVIHSKLNGVHPKSIISFWDYDLTLAEKLDKKNTDHAPLTAAAYIGLRELASRTGRMVIITARGEASLLGYLGQHERVYGRLKNTTAATNSGHRWHPLEHKKEVAVKRIAVPGIAEDKIETVFAEIHNLVTKLSKEFTDITFDHREMCGAVVFQFPGGENNSRFMQFQHRADILKSELPEEMRNNIAYARKSWLTGDVMQGYIDITPKGMSKGVTTPILSRHYSQQIGGEPFVIAAGDSSADYAMMEALAKEVPANRRLFISVGDGLVGCDDAHKKQTGEALLDIVLTGDGKLRPVQQLHANIIPMIGISDRATSLDMRRASGSVSRLQR